MEPLALLSLSYGVEDLLQLVVFSFIGQEGVNDAFVFLPSKTAGFEKAKGAGAIFRPATPAFQVIEKAIED